jgi:hypothetical protein
MKRSLLALVLGLTLVAGRTSRADDRPTGKTGKGGATMGQTGMMDEPKKHLSEVDLYLRDAINNAKVLYETTQMQPGKLDATIQREDLSNIEKALSGAQTHLQHVKSMPEAKVQDADKVSDQQRRITEAKSMVVRLRTAVRSDNKSQIQTMTSQLYASLKSADDTFGQIAEKQNLTRVDKIDVPEKQPVGGRTDENTPSPSPSQQPGGGENIPPSRQPMVPQPSTPAPSPGEMPSGKPQPQE